MKKSWIYIISAIILFSTMEIALKQIAGDFNPMQLTLTRFLIGGIFLIPFAVNRMKKKRRTAQENGSARICFAWPHWRCRQHDVLPARDP